MQAFRRLPLSGLHNARDLGGYPAPGGITKYGVFVRSELPSELTAGDLDFLRRYGITADIDFRGSVELSAVPDALANESWLEYIHIPIYDEAAARGALPKKFRPISSEFTWGDNYKKMADKHMDWVRRVFEAMAEADGAVLFHCTTGKDRAGLISAALLGLCGVGSDDIISDYCVSEVYLRPVYQKMAAFSPEERRFEDLSDPFFSTAPKNMSALLEHIDSRYGGIPAYLQACGLREDTLNSLQNRLSCPYTL